jgi:hypothetical protein
MDLSRKTNDRYARAIAHHDLMTVEKLAGELDRAIQHGWDAFQAYDSEEGSIRALFDLAGVLRESGELQAARDAYTVVVSQVKGSEYRILSLDALAYISALQGEEEAHESIRRRMDEEGWEEASPVYLAQIFYYRGLACRSLGREEEARYWLERGLAYAEEHGLSKLIFDAEKALQEAPPNPESGTSLESLLQDPWGEEILTVRQGLRELREARAGPAGVA